MEEFALLGIAVDLFFVALGFMWATPTVLAVLPFLLILWALRQIQPWRYNDVWEWRVVDRSWLSAHFTRWAACTLGYVIVWRDPTQAVPSPLRAHELRHVWQNFLLGPLFLPAYALGWFWGAVRGDYYFYNPFEADAREHAPGS